jgi:hypothetical protein
VTALCAAFNQFESSSQSSTGRARVNTIMTDQGSKVECPLCEGHGTLTQAQVSDQIAAPEFRNRLDARIAKILEEAGLATVGAPVRNFEHEVHQWNPALPIWRRSPKE